MKIEETRTTESSRPAGAAERRSSGRKIASVCSVPQRERERSPDEIADITATYEELFAARQGLEAFYRLLLRWPLGDKERKERSGRLYKRAPRFVREVARTLKEEGPLFPEVTSDPQRMAEMQRLADLLRLTVPHFHLLARLCQDTFIDVQSELIGEGLQVVDHVKQDDKRTFDRLPASVRLDRKLAMSVADGYGPPRGRGAKHRDNRHRTPRNRPKKRSH